MALALGLVFPRAAPAAGTWTETGRLAEGRNDHTATRLTDGRVLVAGGYAGPGIYLASAEIFDPATGRWSATGSLDNGRQNHTATLLLNGRVLVTGGYHDGYLASAELFNPATGIWVSPGPLNIARINHTATLLPDGRVLVAGGTNGSPLASAELFNPAEGTWTSPGPLSTTRASHTATLLADGRVLVVGGYSVFGIFQERLASAELFNPADGTWSATDSLLNARSSHTATLLPDGRVLVAGGYAGPNTNLASAEIFNPADGTWIPTGDLFSARSSHTDTLMADGQVLVAGGYDGVNYLRDANIFNPATGTWARPFMVIARSYHAATLLPDGRVLVVGGVNEDPPDGVYLSNTEIYDAKNLINNGSFETATINSGALESGSDALANWTIGGGGVDYRTWQGAEGGHSLDLNYLDAGSIQQTIPTNLGKCYQVTFALAGNPGGTQRIKTLRVSAAGQYRDFTFDTTGKSVGNMGWTSKSWIFRGKISGSTLKFESLNSGVYGPALDKVRVTLAPPPLPLLLLLE